ncbi:hypothetical protein [Pseudomonas sp. PDM19]|uniref:hypothetical protein n=1 Tax=Pseudomonas sp. PDM19 TaxID=2769272 RepID=UPI00177B12AF|nr:hypothetical protein [Pseudomonas sp. PDM19]MBD9632802.1 hypothetical protein [Pseudomonas sp. PDM19]
MPAIRRQGRRFLLLWCCRAVAAAAALAWVFQRRFGVRSGFVFRPLGRVPFVKRHKRNQKGLPRTSGFSLGAKNSLVELKFQGHALTGHPWPDSALATSMSLNP